MKIETKDVWFVVDAKNYLSGVVLTFPSVCYTSLEDAKSDCGYGDVPVSAYMLMEQIINAMKKYR